MDILMDILMDIMTPIMDEDFKNKVTDICARTWILENRNIHNHPSLLIPYIRGNILPSKDMVDNRWRLYSKIWERIMNTDLGLRDELGVWTPSYTTGIRSSGSLWKFQNHWYCFNYLKNAHFLEDLYLLKFPFKLTRKYQDNKIILHNAPFFEHGINLPISNEKEYLAGLFTMASILFILGDQWCFIKGESPKTLEGIKTLLEKWTIIYKKYKNGIIISPFYGALFTSNMPINSQKRVKDIKKAGMCPELPLLYWNVCVRRKMQPIAPIRKGILPYAVSYATHWNRGMMKYPDIRKRGVDVGILGVYEGLRYLILEWVKNYRNQ